MRILVTGSSGLVGSHVIEALKDHEVKGVSRGESEFTDVQLDLMGNEVVDFLDEFKPEVIVHSAAKTHVDYAEDHIEETRESLVKPTQVLADWCEKNNAFIIFISTDYVYAGKEEEQPYTEESPAEPLNVFGKLKMEAEEACAVAKHCILRTGVVYGLHKGGKNFLMQLLAQKDPRNVPADQVSNPTAAFVLAEYIKKIIEKQVEGLYNATGPDQMGRYEFAKMIAEVFDLDASLYNPKTTAELQQTAGRPLFGGTDSSKLWQTIDWKPPSVRESLLALKNQSSIF